MASEKRLKDVSLFEKALEKHRGLVMHNEDILAALANCHSIDAVEVVHGRWEPRTDAFGFVRCSVCHDCNIYDDWADGKKWSYCPNCGAKMDGDGND